MQRLFVGRHAAIAESGKGLSTESQNEARTMARWLLDQESITARAVLVSSIAERAIQTARIIRTDLQLPTLVQTKYMYGAGIHPEMVRDLSGLIRSILDETSISHEGQDVIVVAHEPLVKAVAGDNPEPGRMYEVPSGWENPVFDSSFERILQRPELW